MKIISPVDNFKEARPLLEAGADELYGGYLPPEWQDYSLAASLNQRTFSAAQIETETELGDIIRATHDAGARFALTLNAPFYTDAQAPLLLDYVDNMVRLGIDGVILADIDLLRRLNERHPQIEYHASTLAHLSNAGAVKFMAKQGINRAILPRHLTVDSMAEIIKEVEDVRFDAFLMVGKCPNTEGLCTFHHSSPDKIWPCEISYHIEPLHDESDPDLRAAILRQGSWAKTNRRHGCGLCAIPYLKQAGVYGLKLVGRGAPAAQKVRNVSLTKEFLELADELENFNEYRNRAMAAHQQRFGAACHQNVCYYPEFFYLENGYGGIE